MGYFHDDDDEDTSSNASLISDIADKHCPDSVRQKSYQELERRGIDRNSARAIADKKHGDFWG
jgi:hypothetical protein